MSEGKIKFKIATPERVLFKTDGVNQVSIPTQMGEITVLENHLPMTGILASGELLAQKGDLDIPIAVTGGFFQVNKNEVIILADTADYVEEISVEEAEKARAKAEEMMKKKESLSKSEYASFASQIEKELAKIKVARKFQTKKYRKLPGLDKNI